MNDKGMAIALSRTVAGPAAPGARSGLRHTGTINYRKGEEL